MHNFCHVRIGHHVRDMSSIANQLLLCDLAENTMNLVATRDSTLAYLQNMLLQTVPNPAPRLIMSRRNRGKELSADVPAVRHQLSACA